MRRDCKPCLVSEAGEHTLLERLPFNESTIAEEWLQKTLHRSPDILPVAKLDESFAPVVSVGREIRRIDNLFISPHGRIVVVETKLWRNPEATRQVVAQILDYAQVLSKMTYEELESQIKDAIPTELDGRSLFEFVRDSFDDASLDEATFIDEVTTTLRCGQFMLLIVGDGIREGIENMIDLIHRQPQMLFTFGLIEIQLFKADSLDGILAVPQVIAHSNEIERITVSIEGGSVESARVTVDVASEEKAGKSSRQKRKPTETELFEALGDDKIRESCKGLIKLGRGLGAEPSFGARYVTLRLPDPGGSKKMLSIFGLDTSGEFYTWGLDGQLRRAGLDPAIAMAYAERLAALVPDISMQTEYATLSRYLSAAEVEENFDSICNITTDTVNQIKDAAAAASAGIN